MDMLYDTILDLLDNKEKINNLGKAAQLRALKEFTWEEVIKNHMSTYKKNNII